VQGMASAAKSVSGWRGSQGSFHGNDGWPDGHTTDGIGRLIRVCAEYDNAGRWSGLRRNDRHYWFPRAASYPSFIHAFVRYCRIPGRRGQRMGNRKGVEILQIGSLLLWQVGLTSGVTFLTLNLVMVALGLVIGAPGAGGWQIYYLYSIIALHYLFDRKR